MQNGQKPTESEYRDFYQLFHDKTINPFGFGFVGSMFKHQIIQGKAIDCVSIDYLRYISGERNYIDGQ